MGHLSSAVQALPNCYAWVFPKHSADFPSVSTNRSKRKWIPLPAKHHCLKEGGILRYKNKLVSQVGWSPYLTLATPWTLRRLWFELRVGTFVLLIQNLGTDLCFSQNKKKNTWSSGFFRWLTVALLMFLIWDHIGMQNCFFSPYSISFGLEFCIYVCCMLWNGWEASPHMC